jgi:hypothetical protein
MYALILDQPQRCQAKGLYSEASLRVAMLFSKEASLMANSGHRL